MLKEVLTAIHGLVTIRRNQNLKMKAVVRKAKVVVIVRWNDLKVVKMVVILLVWVRKLTEESMIKLMKDVKMKKHLMKDLTAVLKYVTKVLMKEMS